MKHTVPVLAASLLLTFGSGLIAQTTPAPTDRSQAGTRARAETKKDADVSYGRIKEITAGEKIVVDIDNAPDKSFDLADKDLKVTLAKGLKVGDTVKVTEHDVMGKTKSVAIAKHSGGGVTHGDKDPAKKP
jgi:hypothetical protein